MDTPNEELKAGELVDKLITTKEKITALTKKHIKPLKDEVEELEGLVQAKMQGEGIDQIRGKSGSASLTTSEVPAVEDWERFYKWLYTNKAGYMLERRVSATSWRALLEQRNGRAVPGVGKFTKRAVGTNKRRST